MRLLHQHKVVMDESDHVFITVETKDRPVVTLDITNEHGRRTLGVRVNGMGIGFVILDVEELPPMRESALMRYCGTCGEQIALHSSRAHQCAIQL